MRISPFQAGLLSLAFGTGHARIPRSAVQKLLWDRDSDKTVRHRLSQLVYQTNQRCQARVIELDGEYLRMDTEAVATDLEHLKRLIRDSDFKAACDIFERGFLSAFPNRKTEALSDWIETQAHGMRAHLRNRALAEWNASEAVHDWSGARSSAEALYRLDPHDEAGLRRVIRAHAMGGRVGEAEAVYRSFAERADPSGGWAPQRETTQLLKSLESVHKRPAERARVAHTRNLPLAGRAHELSQLGRSIGHDRHRDAWSIVTISGEAGLGKTRLIEEVIQGIQFRGYNVMYACIGEFERNVPFSPLLEALGAPWVGPLLSSVSDPWRSHLLSLLPQFNRDGKMPPHIANDRAGRLERHTCEAFLQMFTTITQSQPAVLVLDDFHWADEATATVVQFLHRRWPKGELSLLLAYRTEELGRNAAAASVVNALEAESEATSVRLHELEDAAATQLVASLGKEELTESAVSDIVTLAGGNPLFLIEIAADALARPGPERKIRIPDSVRRSIVRRIGELAPAARGIMSALAVLGHPVTMRSLTRLTAHTRHECIDALDLLADRRLVEWTGDRVSIRQRIVRRAVYQGLSPTRRSLLHALTAELLRSQTRHLRPDRIATHYYRAGERQLACIYALEAAKPAATRHPGDRSRFLRIAYETSEEARRRRLTFPLAGALHRSRQLADGVRYATKALTRAHNLSLEESFTARLIIIEARAFLGQEAPSTTLDELATLESAALKEREEAVLGKVLDTTLRLLHRGCDRKGATRLFARLKRMEGLHDPLANCRVLAALAMQAEYDNPAEGLVYARRAVTIAREHQLNGEEMLTRQRHITALAANGLLATEEGRTSVAESRTAARRSDDLASYLLILVELARWHTATEGVDIASTILDEAHTLVERTDCPDIQCLMTLARGNLALARSDLPAALAALAKLQGATGTPERAAVPHSDPVADVHRERAGLIPVPCYLAGALAALEGRVLLEAGKFRQAATIVETHPATEPLTNIAIDLILFHARLRSRKGDVSGALDLLERAADTHESERPLHWFRLTLDLVRLARRNNTPKPELAACARDRALQLDLPALAHEFVPFM